MVILKLVVVSLKKTSRIWHLKFFYVIVNEWKCSLDQFTCSEQGWTIAFLLNRPMPSFHLSVVATPTVFQCWLIQLLYLKSQMRKEGWVWNISHYSGSRTLDTYLYLVKQGTCASTIQATCSLLFSAHVGSHYII